MADIGEREGAFQGVIENPPGIGDAIGEFVVSFNTLEFSTTLILASILGEKIDVDLAETFAFAVLGRMQSLSEKCEVIEGCANVLSKTDPERSKKAIDIINRIKSVNAKRNQYIHGHWYYQPNSGKLHIDTKLMNSRAKSKIISDIVPDMILADRDEVLKINSDMARFIGFQPSKRDGVFRAPTGA